MIVKNRSTHDRILLPCLGQLDESQQNAMLAFFDTLPLYQSAMQDIVGKFEELDSEFTLLCGHNPIHQTKSRIKTHESIVEKALKRNHPITLESLHKNITDVAGLRVVCRYTSDLYLLGGTLLAHPDIRLLRQSDYIKAPKANGYRSLHLIVGVPLTHAQSTQIIPVEIQLRTIAMDMWASLEHEIRYKSEKGVPEAEAVELNRCAQDLSRIDGRMEAMYMRIHRPANPHEMPIND